MDKKILNKIKDIYKPGTEIFLVSKNSKPHIPSTSKGIVKKVDDLGFVHIDWNNGEKTTLKNGVDIFYKL